MALNKANLHIQELSLSWDAWFYGQINVIGTFIPEQVRCGS